MSMLREDGEVFTTRIILQIEVKNPLNRDAAGSGLLVWENNSDVMSTEESVRGINHIRTFSIKQDTKLPVNTWM